MAAAIRAVKPAQRMERVEHALAERRLQIAFVGTDVMAEIGDTHDG